MIEHRHRVRIGSVLTGLARLTGSREYPTLRAALFVIASGEVILSPMALFDELHRLVRDIEEMREVERAVMREEAGLPASPRRGRPPGAKGARL